MKKRSKKFKRSLERIEKGKYYPLEEAVKILKDIPHSKFDETVEISCNLNIDPKQSEQAVRGTIVLPHGVGKDVRICAFCKGEDIKKAQEAGADFVGSSELIEKVKNGWMEFDQVVSTQEMLKETAQLGKILGPRGMMPSPKTGTVGADIAQMVKELKSGKVQFKADKTANIHAAIGKMSFSVENICENAQTLMKAILNVRPASIKGRFIKKVTISITMSPSINLDLGRIAAQ